MEYDEDKQCFPDVEISINQHADAESLYDEFCVELDPIRDHGFLQRLGDFEPGRWLLLEELCDSLDGLPDHAAEITARFPGRFAMCHVPWLGKCTDDNQPDSMIMVGDRVSMYHRAMLLNVEAATGPPG